jgi:hypothetical protein
MNNQEIVRPKIDHNSSFRWLSIGPEKMFIKSRKGGERRCGQFSSGTRHNAEKKIASRERGDFF